MRTFCVVENFLVILLFFSTSIQGAFPSSFNVRCESNKPWERVVFFIIIYIVIVAYKNILYNKSLCTRIIYFTYLYDVYKTNIKTNKTNKPQILMSPKQCFNINDKIIKGITVNDRLYALF